MKRLRRPSFWILVPLVVVALLVAAAGLDLLLVSWRIHHDTVTMPRGGTGTTYVVVGSDSRSALPPGAPDIFGNPNRVPGQRSDVVLVVHTVGARTWVLSVPRDLLVSPSPGTVDRLTLTFAAGAQQLVDGLCRSLNITTNHLVVVNFRSFAQIVDDVGGITVRLPYPVRDSIVDLGIPRAGAVHLNGFEALALVRSRTPQWLVRGRWTTVPNGATQRTLWAGKVFAAVLHAVKGVGLNPLTLQKLAWTGAGTLTTSQGTGLFDLLHLAHSSGSALPLPVSSIPNTIAVRANALTHRTLERAGFAARCHLG